MKSFWLPALAVWLLAPRCVLPAAEARRPNVVVLLADDMGYSDLGCYGGEMATPNLDGLAKDGLRFTQFYNTARCWPSRAALLTGYYAQQVRRDLVPGVKSGGVGVRPPWGRLLPEMLRPLGYRSYHIGKWHLDGKPMQNGFDHSYSLWDHNNHFAPRTHLGAMENTLIFFLSDNGASAEMMVRGLVPLFAKDGAVGHDSLWWRHEGNRALRVGDWKIVAAGEASAWELYDLRADRAEMKNLAAEMPEKVRELAAEWTRQTEEYNALARPDAPPATGGKPPVKSLGALPPEG